MSFTQQQAVDSASIWFEQWEKERDRLDKFDKWLRGTQDLPPSPRRSTPEHKMLRELARGPWLRIVVTALSQTLHVDGYRSPTTPATNDDNPRTGPPSPWDIFLANALDSRQAAVHWSTLGYGYAFGKLLPGVAPDGRKMAAITGVSARHMYAAWANPAEDDWPILALEVRPQPGGTFALALYDEEKRYRLSMAGGGSKAEYISEDVHGAGFCPIARCANELDLDGRTMSEIEPLIDNARRIDKTVYDRLLAQHFNSWKVRWAVGLAMPDPPEGLDEGALEAWKQREKMRLAQEDILASDNHETKFGTLDATALDGFISAHEADLEDLSAASQMARHNFGEMVNMPAEAFTAAETMQQRRRTDRQRSFGRFWNQLLRAAAGMSGNAEAAADYQAHVTWSDTESRSLSQAADALGKLAAQLEIPPEALWERIPGVTDTDIATFKALRDQGAETQLSAQLRKIADGGGQPPQPPAPGQ